MTIEETIDQMIEEAEAQEDKIATKLQKIQAGPPSGIAFNRYSQELAKFYRVIERLNTLYELKGRLST